MDETKNGAAALAALHAFHARDKIALLEELRSRYGEGVLDAVEQVECARAFSLGRALGEGSEDRSIGALLERLWEPLRSQGFEFVSREEGGGVRMSCTACPLQRLAESLGAQDLMFRHACAADAAIAEGFNPRIAFSRTKTLMAGDAECDHFYRMKD